MNNTDQTTTLTRNDDGHDDIPPEVRDAEAEAEARAEFAMSWVCGGGLPEDIGARWSAERWDIER